MHLFLVILAAVVFPVSIPAWLAMLALGAMGFAGVGFLPIWVVYLSLYVMVKVF